MSGIPQPSCPPQVPYSPGKPSGSHHRAIVTLGRLCPAGPDKPPTQAPLSKDPSHFLAQTVRSPAQHCPTAPPRNLGTGKTLLLSQSPRKLKNLPREVTSGSGIMGAAEPEPGAAGPPASVSTGCHPGAAWGFLTAPGCDPCPPPSRVQMRTSGIPCPPGLSSPQ